MAFLENSIESFLSRISCPRRKKNDMVFLVGLCFFRMENFALKSARTQMYGERRSTARVHQCCCINAVTFVFKTQFLAHILFPAKFIIGRIWDSLLAIIRYIGKIWDGREKVIKTEMITIEILTECKLLLLERPIISQFFQLRFVYGIFFI